jgi:hypothetical protein
MKKVIFTVLLITISSLVFGGNNWTNPIIRKTPFEDLRKPIVMKLSPFHFFDRQLSITGELFGHDYKRSLCISLAMIYADNSKVYDVGTSITLERRFYPRGFNPDTSNRNRNTATGFYFGMGAQVGYSEYNDRTNYSNGYYDPMTGNYFYYNDNVTITSAWITPNITLGYQFILWDALYIDAYVGGGVKVNDTKKTSKNIGIDFSRYYSDPDILSRYYKGVVPRVGLTLGMGF